MGQLPRTEGDMVTLAEAMISGLTEHPDDFPSIAPEGLQSILDDFKTKRDAQLNAQSQTITATEGKATAMEVLATTMKDMLKRAEADTTPDPSKLYEIGWSPRQTPQPVELPGSPTSLHSVAEGQGSLFLEWTRPAAGGPVRSYVVERCQEVPTGGYGPWTIAGTAYNCEITLTNQPVDVKLMYCVKAVNNSGESDLSNDVTVTLP